MYPCQLPARPAHCGFKPFQRFSANKANFRPRRTSGQINSPRMTVRFPLGEERRVGRTRKCRSRTRRQRVSENPARAATNSVVGRLPHVGTNIEQNAASVNNFHAAIMGRPSALAAPRNANGRLPLRGAGGAPTRRGPRPNAAANRVCLRPRSREPPISEQGTFAQGTEDISAKIRESFAPRHAARGVVILPLGRRARRVTTRTGKGKPKR